MLTNGLEQKIKNVSAPTTNTTSDVPIVWDLRPVPKFDSSQSVRLSQVDFGTIN